MLSPNAGQVPGRHRRRASLGPKGVTARKDALMRKQRIDYYDSREAPKAKPRPGRQRGRGQRRGRDPADPPHRQRQLGRPRRRGRHRRVRRPGRSPRDTRGIRDPLRDHRHRRHLLGPQARDLLHQQWRGTAGVLDRPHRPATERTANTKQRIKRRPVGPAVRTPRLHDGPIDAHPPPLLDLGAVPPVPFAEGLPPAGLELFIRSALWGYCLPPSGA